MYMKNKALKEELLRKLLEKRNDPDDWDTHDKRAEIFVGNKR